MPKEKNPEPRSRSKSSGFWSFSRILFIVIFLVGFVAGIITMNQISPFFENSGGADCTNIQAANSTLDKQIDSCTSCLNSQGINPQTCEKP